jgi:hypothetical protein
MTPNGGQPKNGAVDTDATANVGTRQPYRAPQLRRLGSVRELTLGMSGVGLEGFFMKMSNPM